MTATLIVARDGILDPERRRHLTMAPGTSIAAMVEEAYAAAPAAVRSMLRATIDGHVVPRHLWPRVRPKPGTTVALCPVPGDDILRNVLTIAVTVGSIALGQLYGAALANSLVFGAGSVGSGGLGSLFSAAITGTALFAGTLLVNALVPPSTDGKDRPSYAIQGLRNQATPDGAVPFVLGRVRYAPPYAALPYTEAIGDDRYVRAAFCNGYGPLKVRDPRIGETPIDRFKGVQIETLEGYPTDPDLTLYPRQVVEKPFAVELKNGGPYGGPQSRFTAADVTDASVDITFPMGLAGYEKEGKRVSLTVVIQARYRKVGTAEWAALPQWSITAKSQKPVTRTFPIGFPSRGRYEIDLLRVTEDDPEDQSKKDIQRNTVSTWTALRSFRPETIVNFDAPLSLTAVRILASGQLQGTLDEFNAEYSSICPDWDAAAGTWVAGETSNPASLFRYVLTGPGMRYPLTEDEIAALGEWHAFCLAKGLTFNKVFAGTDTSVLDALTQVAAAGRASPHDTGTRWGVVIDRALATVSAHVSPRNSWGFSGERSFVRFPDAFRVRFNDETNSHKPADRIVPWPGFSGDPKSVEEVSMPGVTNPDMLWREVRRRQYELIHRPDTYTANQDFEVMSTGRGDRVELSHDVLDRAQVGARVRSVQDASGRVLVVLDEAVTMEAGQAYAVRFRRSDGATLLRTVQTVPGETALLVLTGSGDAPEIGDLALFGPASRVSLSCTVKGIEAMKDLTARLTLIDHAPQIEALVDAEVPPPWDGRAGAPADETTDAPLRPIILDVVSGRLAAGAATDAVPYPVVVSLEADPAGTERIATFEVRHRLGSAGDFTTSSAPAGAGSVLLPGYTKGDSLVFQARAVSLRGTPGNWTDLIAHVVAATDPAAPAAPSALSATSPATGKIRIQATSGPDAQTVGTRFYLASGASAAFSGASPVATLASGPNTVLPPYEVGGLAAGAYRIWATTLDGNRPANESDLTGPITVTVT